MKIQHSIVSCVVVMFFTFITVAPLLAGPKSQINKNWRRLAIKGYDAVAYFKDGMPVQGSKDHEFEWKEAKWRFSSAEYRDIFTASPEKYAQIGRASCRERV